MNISIDLEFLKKQDITPNEYVYLYCIKHDVSDGDRLYLGVEEFLAFEKKGFIRQDPFCSEEDMNNQYSYNLTGAGLALFEERPNEFLEFVENYRNLFPKDKRSGNGTPIRGDRSGIIKKMTWFLTTHPEFSKELILNTTKDYIEQMRRQGFNYITQADYLIQKSGSSKLAALCEVFNSKTANLISSGERRL